MSTGYRIRLLSYFLCCGVWLGFVGLLPAQEADLSGWLDRVIPQIGEVETAKYRYVQSLVSDSARPWRATFTKAEINLKNDKTTTESFTFNLADFDTNLIRIEDSKNELVLKLKTDRNKDLIEVEEDGERQNYVSEIEIHMTDIDQARALKTHLESVIPSAAEAWEAAIQIGETIEEINEWLTAHVIAVATNDERVDQEWTIDAERPELIVFSQAEIDKKGDREERVYRFNLADLTENAVDLEIRGDRLRVTVATKAGADFIFASEADGKTRYTDEFYVAVEDIDAARQLIRFLRAAIPLAEKITKDRLPQLDDLADALQRLVATVTGAETEDETIRVAISPEVLTTVVEQRRDKKDGDESSARYLFHFGDLTAASAEVTVKGEDVALQLETIGGKKYVQRWENEELDGYTAQISLPVGSIEAARLAKHLVQYVIEAARQTEVEPADFAWLQQVFAQEAPENERQLLEPGEENCEWEFTGIEIGSKADKERIYVLNLYDIDSRRMDFKVSSKTITLTLPTLRGEKIINVYEDGDPSFTDELEIQFSNLANAKRAKATVKSLVEACES